MAIKKYKNEGKKGIKKYWASGGESETQSGSLGGEGPYNYKDMAEDKVYMSNEKIQKDKGSRAFAGGAEGSYHEVIPDRNPIYKVGPPKIGGGGKEYGDRVSVTSRGRDVDRIKDRSDITEGQTGGRYEGRGHRSFQRYSVSEDTGRLQGLKHTRAGKGGKGIANPKKQTRKYSNNTYTIGE